jgi:hypothetical protein
MDSAGSQRCRSPVFCGSNRTEISHSVHNDVENVSEESRSKLLTDFYLLFTSIANLLSILGIAVLSFDPRLLMDLILRALTDFIARFLFIAFMLLMFFFLVFVTTARQAFCIGQNKLDKLFSTHALMSLIIFTSR